MQKQYIYINGWQAKIRFSSAHVIPEYEKCGRLHGHTYAIHAKIYGKPDEKGIIIDFSILKQALKEIAENLDHKILIPKESTSVHLQTKNQQITVNSLGKTYQFPLSDCRLLAIPSTSAENLASYVCKELESYLQDHSNVEMIEVGVDEGYGQGAFITKTIISP